MSHDREHVHRSESRHAVQIQKIIDFVKINYNLGYDNSDMHYCSSVYIVSIALLTSLFSTNCMQARYSPVYTGDSRSDTP
jgi:hypothetical protein